MLNNEALTMMGSVELNFYRSARFDIVKLVREQKQMLKNTLILKISGQIDSRFEFPVSVCIDLHRPKSILMITS